MQENILEMQEFESIYDASFHLSIFCTLSLSSSTRIIVLPMLSWFLSSRLALEMILVHENLAIVNKINHPKRGTRNDIGS
jgi:hypothetical protein